MVDDFFGDDSEEANYGTMNAKTINKLSNKLYNEGYVIGKTNEESRQMQIGFDEGFGHGIALGKLYGQLYSLHRINQARAKNNKFAESEEDVRSLVFDMFPALVNNLKDESLWKRLEDAISATEPALIPEYTRLRQSIQNLND